MYIGYNKKVMLSFEMNFSYYEKWYLKYKFEDISWFDGLLNDVNGLYDIYNGCYWKKN